ncbi:MAG: TonB-dependent receptor [Gammaproteobacteria bacterium]|nr:TonB-dependent receptor [Gammaproteobacteria bacterium]
MRAVRGTVVSLAAVLALTPGAFAQTGDRAASATELEEIVVTARKREESLQETPLAVTAFTATDLEARGLTDLMQVGSFAPNVVMATGQGGSGGGSNGQVYIRGIGQLDFLFTTDPGVAIYIDGVYHARSLGAVMDLLDLERVEILRGPQGTLFGRNTVGGAINVISAKPADEFGGYAEATYGRYDRTDFRGSVNLPLVDDQLLGKVSLSYKNRDGYGDRLDFTSGAKLDETGDQNQLAMRGALRWLISEKLTADLILDYSRVREQSVPTTLLQFDDTGAFGGVPILLWNALIGFPSGTPMSSAFITGDEDTTFGTGPNHNNLDVWGANLTLEWDLGGATAKSISAYRDMNGSFGRDGDGSPLPIVHTDQDQDGRQFSQELQLFGTSAGDRLDWVLGLYYFDEFGRDHNNVVLASGLFGALEALPVQLTGAPCAPPFLAPGCPGNPINPLLDLDFDIFNEINITSIAGFGQATAHFTDRLSLTGGLRYSYEKKEYFLEHRRIASNTFIVPATEVDASWNELTPLVSIQYQWTKDFMTYFTYSEGFKSGGFNGRPTVAAAVESYDPEFLDSYEFGMKSEWFGRRLRLNAAAFFYNYKDLQFTAVSADPASGSLLLVVDNAGEADVKGFEIELLAQPIEGLEVNAATGYTDFVITSLDPGVTEVTLDSEMIRTPEWTASAGIQYTWPWQEYGVFRLRGDWTYESRSYTDIQNTPSLARDAHSIFGARLTWALPATPLGGQWELAAFGTNLTDERVIVSGISALDSFGTAEGFYNRPREWGVQLRMTF